MSAKLLRKDPFELEDLPREARVMEHPIATVRATLSGSLSEGLTSMTSRLKRGGRQVSRLKKK
jgi:hypothetical protein